MRKGNGRYVLLVCVVLLGLAYFTGVLGWVFNVAVRRTFWVNGTVQAEDGSAIQGVTMCVRTSRLQGMGTRSDYEYEFVKLSGSKFEVARYGYSSVYLRFCADGFEGREIGYSQSGLYNNVVVVLRKQPGGNTQR